MHLKNWSIIYPDRRPAALAPAYDFVSTIPYIADEFAAIKYARTKRMCELSLDELRHSAAKARLPEMLIIDAATETVARFHEDRAEAKKGRDPIGKDVAQAIDTHLQSLELVKEA